MSLLKAAVLSLSFLFLACWSSLLPAQERFPKTFFSDSFTADSGFWEIRSDASALYLIQGGEYLLRRLDRTESAVLSNRMPSCDPYRLSATVKVDPGQSTTSYAGLAFMMQEDNAGGFLLEINSKKHYRVRQVVQGSFRLLTGTLQGQGWVQGDVRPGQPNKLSIVYSNKSYELYVNETIVKAFAEPAYKMGRFGFVIGPSATAHVDDVLLSATVDCATATEQSSGPATPTDSLTMIRQLQSEITRLKSEVRMLRDSLQSPHRH